ncbi:WD40-repeat-containing domain protein [Pseudoneurospora amorphoporcata]|uniref:WD40-repeat-containing domain protein n=1 Tax=Pseudoneurospora amorphoporcata TaxID=241081 RepID=A0AAN6P709_9PEZI|nr:WD40-repeat-containing domain protein [Pseudoneurospora amorphoporcata]
MSSTPMDIDEPGAGTPSLNVTRLLGPNGPSTSKVSEVIKNFRPTKFFQRDGVQEGRPQPHVLSIDFDDPGELCMTSESDETIQIYNVREGRHDKSLLSKKYGVKHAKFTHSSSGIIYASTKTNDAIRYLATHDNTFIRYFDGHDASVTNIALHPGSDNFLSCSLDTTVRLWDLSSKNWVARFNLTNPTLAAWDPAGLVFAIALPASASILLYDYRNYVKPFKIIDVLKEKGPADGEACFRGWTKLEFSNDGKHILLGTRTNGHFLFDAIDGNLKAYLRKPQGGTRRAAPGEGDGTSAALESSGDCCFTPDGRYVVSGAAKDLLVWDTMQTPNNKILEPNFLPQEGKKEPVLVQYNPRFNMIATADKDLMFWLPVSDS